MKKIVSILVALALLCPCMSVFADSAKLSSECIRELSARYSVTEGGYGRLDINAEAFDIDPEEYIVFTVYASAEDISDPTNGGANSILTMRTAQASRVISDNLLSYSIEYLSSKLKGKCVVCVQVANRGEVNDWSKAYIEVPVTFVTDAEDTQQVELFAPIGFSVNAWTEENADSIGLADDRNVFMGWRNEKGETVPSDELFAPKDVKFYSVWRLFGDLDNDGGITIVDALMNLRVAAKLAEPNEESLLLGDCDRDGEITVVDSLVILRFVAGLISSWPE